MACCVVIYLISMQYLAAYSLPFFSEDYTQIAVAEAWTSWTQAFSPDLVPLRPFQHLLTYWEAHSALRVPSLARIPGFLLHFGSCFLVLRIARQLGLKTFGAAAAMVLYALYPNYKSLVWTASIGWPGRQFFMLAGLTAYISYTRQRSALAAATAITCMLLSLGFHQGAFVFPVFAALIDVAANPGDHEQELLPRMKRLMSAPLAVMIALVSLYMLYIMFLRDNRHTEVRDLAALPANIIKGSLSLFPEWIRLFVIDGLRAGGTRFYLAASLFLLLPISASLIFWRGSRLTRCLMLCIALELFIPMMTVGFVQRYSYLASALLAILISTWLQRERRAPHPLALGLTLVIAAVWAKDSLTDIREYEECGKVADQMVETIAAELSAKQPEQIVVVLNPPACWGAESDISMFNWGLGQAVARYMHKPSSPGSSARLALWRTEVLHSNFTNSDVKNVSAEKVQAAIENPGVVVLQYSAELQRLTAP